MQHDMKPLLFSLFTPACNVFFFLPVENNMNEDAAEGMTEEEGLFNHVFYTVWMLSINSKF